jgi:hypothetical protein
MRFRTDSAAGLLTAKVSGKSAFQSIPKIGQES